MAIEIMIDTNAYSAFKRGVDEAVKVIQAVDAIYMNSAVLGELLGGFCLGDKEEWNKNELNQFLNSSRVKTVSISKDTAAYYATIYKQLRKDGNMIPTNDLWIAASALQHGTPIFTYDGHFSKINNLLTGSELIDFIEYK